ncbi:unnamed protein product [Microthlaspi erraticum]|uniref:Uncharacterized protein n=1 Tax=Microthlaspi erraticum TaxID=1685480 RepID=A0A6D2JWI3_9BRAS|nr:unnamed protein product [Microthlaspi erraticum]CAA7058493.1 unnamed protein product [Microthlaspi erraticum]
MNQSNHRNINISSLSGRFQNRLAIFEKSAPVGKHWGGLGMGERAKPGEPGGTRRAYDLLSHLPFHIARIAVSGRPVQKLVGPPHLRGPARHCIPTKRPVGVKYHPQIAGLGQESEIQGSYHTGMDEPEPTLLISPLYTRGRAETIHCHPYDGE